MFLVRRPSDAELSQIAASMIDAPSPTTRWRRPPVRMSCQEGYHQVHAARVLGTGTCSVCVPRSTASAAGNCTGARATAWRPTTRPSRSAPWSRSDVPLVALLRSRVPHRLGGRRARPIRLRLRDAADPPESGEEAFVVERDLHDAAGTVRLVIAAPATAASAGAAGGTCGAATAARATQGYSEALATHARGACLMVVHLPTDGRSARAPARLRCRRPAPTRP